jgi:homoserine kinase
LSPTTKRITVFAPASIGNVGPGFDVLGLAVDGLGDTITAEPTDGSIEIGEITGRDATLVPTDPEKNAACIAAKALLASIHEPRGVRLYIHKGLPLSGGLGGSAASSVAGALAAAAVFGHDVPRQTLTDAALAGEQAVAGRHLDNIAPCLWGGFTLVRSHEPPDIVSLSVRNDWWLALCTPKMRLETKAARAVLPAMWERHKWVQQMANTGALVHAFAQGDEDLARRSLQDDFAEPARAPLIPGFHHVKRAALEHGAFGCSISGAGPTIFAMCAHQEMAETVVQAMQKAFGAVGATAHVGRIDRQGARIL